MTFTADMAGGSDRSRRTASKINGIRANTRKRAFEVPVTEVFVNPELGNEGFTYRLRNGDEDSVHLDAVRDYDRDPRFRLAAEDRARIAVREPP